MSYLRKLTVLGLAALALATSSSNAPAAATPPSVPVIGHGHARTYRVYYGKHSRKPWEFYGSYNNVREAEAAVWNMRILGYEAYYR